MRRSFGSQPFVLLGFSSAVVQGALRVGQDRQRAQAGKQAISCEQCFAGTLHAFTGERSPSDGAVNSGQTFSTEGQFPAINSRETFDFLSFVYVVCVVKIGSGVITVGRDCVCIA